MILSFLKKGFLEGATGVFQGGGMLKLHLLHDALEHFVQVTRRLALSNRIPAMISVMRKIV